MPIHNFMLEDLAACLKAICVFPLVVVAPGFGIAWLCDVFEFRRRTLAFRLALGIPFSIAVCPVATYLLGRFFGMTAVGGFYIAAACLFLSALLRSPRPVLVSREAKVFAAAAAIWLAVALGSLIDLQFGDRLYYPTSALDNSVRTSFVHSISMKGIPPENPLFVSAEPAPLRYHYFWLMMCSLVEKAGRGAWTARHALIAGTFWCGAGLLALVALYLRLFMESGRAGLRRRMLIAFLLLGITGLDIIPTVLLLLQYAAGGMSFVLPSVEWWNEHVDWFVYTALWAPHALSSLLACFTGFLLVWKAPRARGRLGMLRYSVLAGIALASSIGASIYVSFAFAVFLAAWTAVTIVKRWHRETVALLAAGATCAVLALPYLMSLLGEGAPPVSGGAPLEFTVRAFSLAALVPGWPGMTRFWRLILVNLPLIPFNYLLEFGFFLAAGAIAWRRQRRSGRPLQRWQLASLLMVASSAMICTFLRSSIIGCNDLGWRGFLVTQFVMLLWSADLLADGLRGDFISGGERVLLTVFLVLGALGTVYDLAITRTFPILADHGVVPPLDWMSPDRQFGKRTYAARAAYEWAQGATTATAAIQFNPKVAFQETTAMLYSERRTVAANLSCGIGFGGDAKLCPPIMSELQRLYPAPGLPAVASIDDVCTNLPVDLMIAKDTDSAWADRSGWVWREHPAFQNAYVRIFRCPARRVPADGGTSTAARGGTRPASAVSR